MKKIGILFSASVFAVLFLQAQQNQPRFLTELSFGPSIPIGRFAATSTNSTSKAAGNAKTGLSTQLSLGYYLNRSFGLLFSSGYSVHPSNEQARIDKFANYGFVTDHIDSESWKEVKLMAGGFYSAPLKADSKLRFMAKLTAGVCKTAIPKINWAGHSVFDQALAFTDNREIKMPWAFCYQAGASLQYKFSQKWYLLVNASYFNATPVQKYNFTLYSPQPGIPVPAEGGTVQVKSKYALSAINALAGIGIDF